MKDLLREEQQTFAALNQVSASTAPDTTAAPKKRMLWGTKTRLGQDLSNALKQIH